MSDVKYPYCQHKLCKECDGTGQILQADGSHGMGTYIDCHECDDHDMIRKSFDESENLWECSKCDFFEVIR